MLIQIIAVVIEGRIEGARQRSRQTRDPLRGGVGASARPSKSALMYRFPTSRSCLDFYFASIFRTFGPMMYFFSMLPRSFTHDILNT